MFPIMSEKVMMGINKPERTDFPQGRRVNASNIDRYSIVRGHVQAAGFLRKDSSTEIIDVDRLSQRSTSAVQYAEIADVGGRLCCPDRLVSTPCWLKMIPLAKDCQSCNVLLMSTDNGVVLKTIRNITPGEPLSMWFTEHILAMLNMPFLTPANIQGQNRYMCHICESVFEYPNPLKLHIALDCNRVDNDRIWSLLARGFTNSLTTSLSRSVIPQTTFTFKLMHPRSLTVTTNTSSILIERMHSGLSPTQRSFSNRTSSPSSSPQLPPSSTRSSSNAPAQKSSLRRPYSAFKPYTQQRNLLVDLCPSVVKEEHTPTSYSINPPAAPLRNDAHAAQMENIVSNLGKSTQGHLCIYCGKVYSRKYGLKIHIRTHTGYKPLKCKYCFRAFGDPSNLNKHIRLHADGDTPYKCDTCGKLLVRRRDLERHIKSRHRENTENVSDSSSDVAINV